jgi:hypothetical protein
MVVGLSMSSQLQARTVTREELYEQVWKTPIINLAKEYGVSDVAVAKACKRLNVPRPPRGYWARIAVGQKIKRPQLPPATSDTQRSTTIDPSNSLVYPKADSAGSKPLQVFAVPENLHGCHPLITATRKSLESLKPGENGLVWASGPGTLRIETTRESMHRALCLMEALIRGAEANGWTVKAGSEKSGTTVVIGEEYVSLEMKEKMERLEIEPPPNSPEWWNKKSSYSPTGRFTIRITNFYYFCGTRQSWSDGKKQRLDKIMPEVLAGIRAAAEQMLNKRLENEERERRWAEESRRREELEKRIKAEKKRRELLKLVVKGWRHAEEIRRLCDEFERRSEAEPGKYPAEGAQRWLSWARTLAAQCDPFCIGYFEEAMQEEGWDAELDWNE